MRRRSKLRHGSRVSVRAQGGGPKTTAGPASDPSIRISTHRMQGPLACSPASCLGCGVLRRLACGVVAVALALPAGPLWAHPLATGLIEVPESDRERVAVGGKVPLLRPRGVALVPVLP